MVRLRANRTHGWFDFCARHWVDEPGVAKCSLNDVNDDGGGDPGGAQLLPAWLQC